MFLKIFRIISEKNLVIKLGIPAMKPQNRPTNGF